MKNNEAFDLFKRVRPLIKAHPWHGVYIGKNAPEVVSTYIEIVPTDTLKFELDKQSGYLKIDRPQLYSNVCPTPYGLIPQTYCGESVAEFCCLKTGRSGIKGDGDPLDICVLTEKVITHNDIILNAVPIGGLRMIDGEEADDKIIAVMHKDNVFGGWDDISDCPTSLIERIRHYFLTYKEAPGAGKRICEITHVYGREEAYEIIRRSRQDYLDLYSDLNDLLMMNYGEK
ncbi:MAG TPA: inorganic pyrophosphatase [Ignavibacteria bacterium]|nr:inorganic pyrophosphatase [Ignavibacteria bacterium]